MNNRYDVCSLENARTAEKGYAVFDRERGEIVSRYTTPQYDLAACYFLAGLERDDRNKGIK